MYICYYKKKFYMEKSTVLTTFEFFNGEEKYT